MCKVTSAPEPTKGSSSSGSFAGNELLLLTRTPTPVCVCVCMLCVYENSQVKGQAGVFNRRQPKSMLRFSALVFCVCVCMSDITYTPRVATAVRDLRWVNSDVKQFMLLFFWYPSFIFVFSSFAGQTKHMLLDKAKGAERNVEAANQKFPTKNKT